MRTMRIAIATAALFLIAVACGDDDGSTTTTANGSITFAISGDYETSGEFPFVSAASVFSDGNWRAMFAEDGGDAVIELQLIPAGLIVSYTNSQAMVTGYEGECTSSITQNDSSGFVGSFECTGIVGAMTQTSTQITVDVSGEFSAHP
jgi:hypothetical protein